MSSLSGILRRKTLSKTVITCLSLSKSSSAHKSAENSTPRVVDAMSALERATGKVAPLKCVL